MDQTLVALLMVGGGVLLMTNRPGRWMLKTILVTIPLLIITALAFSEPDLRG